MGKTFFISDLHFGHKNILSYDNRPFANIEEHDNQLIKRWNSVVTDEDDVWVLGDICWHSDKKAIEIMKKLKGKKHLCKGNHDAGMLGNKELQKCFVEICHYKELPLAGGKSIVLSHYPIPCFNGHYRNWIHLYGHVHNSFEWHMMERVKYEMESLYEKPCRMFNVGCMMSYMDYTPRTLEEIILFVDTQSTVIQ